MGKGKWSKLLGGEDSMTVLLSILLLLAADGDNRALYALLQSKTPPADQAAAVRKHFNANQLKNGSAVATYLGDFVWAIESTAKPELIVDDTAPVAMRPLPGDLWFFTQQAAIGRSHAF